MLFQKEISMPRRPRLELPGCAMHLTMNNCFLELGLMNQARYNAYQQILAKGITDEDSTEIQSQMQQERTLGSPRFMALVEKALNRVNGENAAGQS